MSAFANPFSSGLNVNLVNPDDYARVLRGTRAEMIARCRADHINRKAVTRLEGRWGTVYGIYLDSDWEANTVTLLGEDGRPMVVRIAHHNHRYWPRTPARELVQVLDGVRDDYPSDSLTYRLAAALGSVMEEVWLADRRSGYVQGRRLDEVIAQHLAGFVRAGTVADPLEREVARLNEADAYTTEHATTGFLCECRCRPAYSPPRIDEEEAQ